VVLLIDPDSHLVLDCNRQASRLLRLSKAQLLQHNILELAEQTEPLLELLRQARESTGIHHRNIRLRSPNSKILYFEMSAERLQMRGRSLILLLGQDQTRHAEAESRVLHLAYHDTLTDLPNRTLLTDRVNHALQRSQRSGQHGALLFLDLDNFKRINDSLGHSIGDLLLQELAARLRRTLREEDTISRLGGDEFVVLIEHLGRDPAEADRQIREIARKIRAALAPAYHLNGHELHMTASIGHVVFPRDGQTMETLLRHADLAMYQAKKAGRDTVTRFHPSMDEIATQRMRVENEIRQALQDGHLELYFQPVLRIRDGRILGAEALLRWRHPQEGLILPGRFLPLIEDGALMLTLTDWVLEHACRELATIMATPGMCLPGYLAVNISHQQFHQPDFVARVRGIIEATGADPRHLLFEITETVIMTHAHEARARMLALKELGLRFAIDDFGTGYSSLSYLKQLPADTLKIDRSFVSEVTRDPDDAAIVRTVLGIADHMGMQVVAEGVEHQEQLHFLREHGCTCYQGFLGRPPLEQQAFREELRLNAQLRLVE
jgi:diguanylate cyclase (GGDEF) domain